MDFKRVVDFVLGFALAFGFSFSFTISTSVKESKSPGAAAPLLREVSALLAPLCRKFDKRKHFNPGLYYLE